MTVAENIKFGLEVRGLDIDKDKRVNDLLQLVQLTGLGSRYPRQLSGGQRQSVGIARAVLHNAPILLLDEPTSAMDFSTEALVTQKMQAFSQGKTVVLVTHRTSMLSFVDRVIVVDQGKIVADGPRERIMQALSAGRIARAA